MKEAPASPARDRLPAWAWEVAAAMTLLAWRVAWRPAADLWRDWGVVLSLFWIFTALVPKPRARHGAAVGAILWLLLAYSSRQVPLTLDLIRSVL